MRIWLSGKMTKKRRREPLEELTAQAGGKIIDTEQSITGKSDELHAYYEKALVQLKEIKQVADTQLEQLHEMGDEMWDDLAKDVDAAIARLRFNLDTLVARVDFEETGGSEPPADPKKKRSNTSKEKTTGRPAQKTL